jgi:hypothetical protein
VFIVFVVEGLLEPQCVFDYPASCLWAAAVLSFSGPLVLLSKSVPQMLPELLPWVCLAPIPSASTVETQALHIQTIITDKYITYIYYGWLAFMAGLKQKPSVHLPY